MSFDGEVKKIATNAYSAMVAHNLWEIDVGGSNPSKHWFAKPTMNLKAQSFLINAHKFFMIKGKSSKRKVFCKPNGFLCEAETPLQWSVAGHVSGSWLQFERRILLWSTHDLLRTVSSVVRALVC